MWRQNAPMNEYSESDDSSDTESVSESSEDSDTSTSEEEIKAKIPGGKNKNSQESSVHLRSKDAKASKLSSSNISVRDMGLHKSKEAEKKHIKENTGISCGDGAHGKLLISKTVSHNLKINGGLDWGVSRDSKGQRHYSQHAESRIGTDLHRKLSLLSLRARKDKQDERTKSNVIAKQLAANNRKPPIAPRKPLQQKNEATQSTPSGKPRSKSVNRVAPGKASCSATADFKFTHPRIKSAVPGLAYHPTHGSKPAPFSTRMLAATETLTDSSSSDDDDGDGSDRYSDDSSDDSR